MSENSTIVCLPTVLLPTESSLDESIPANVGFVVPVDEPGMEAKRPCCVSSTFADQ